MRQLLDTEAALRSVIRTAGSAIVCLDIAQRIGEFNPAAEGMFGVPRGEAIGRPYASLFPPALQPKIEGDLRRIAAGATVTDFENAIRWRDGGATVVLWNIQPLLDVDGMPRGVVMVGQDITGRQRAEETLLRQARYLRALTATDRAILGVQRPEGVAAVVLRQVGALLPCRGAAVTALDEAPAGPRLVATAGTIDLARCIDATKGVCEPRVVRNADAGTRTLHLPLLAHDGPLGVLHIEQVDEGPVTSSELEIAGQVADRLAVALRNWHLYEQAEDARRRLEALSTRLVDVQEAERRRLAGELHDEIGQALTGLLLRLEADVAARPATPGGGDGDGQAADVVRELMAQVRDLSHDLRPAILDDLGLLPALLWHVERFSRNTRVPVDLRHDGIERRFAARIETAVYRIVQEALTNVARHAGAAGARVRVAGSDAAIRVGIEDDGAGFDPDALPGASSGLSGMRERATLLGGRFTVRSSPGGGTRIDVELPIDPPQARPPGEP